MRRITAQLLVGWIAAGLLVPPAERAKLKSATVAAFDRYIRMTEDRMEDDLREDYCLFVDCLPDTRRRAIDAQLREGKAEIQQFHTLEEGRAIPIPSGMVHHWVGVIFIPNATLAQARDVLVLLILAWLITPLIENIPKSTISGLLNNPRRAIIEGNSASVGSVASFPSLGSHP